MSRYFDIKPEGAHFSGVIRLGLSFKRQYTSRSASDPWDYKNVMRIETGWPVRSLAGAHLSDRTDEAIRSWYTTAIVNPWVPDNRRIFTFIPYRPIWPGFALNTLLYAAVLWIPFVPFVLRQVLRRRRRACLQCGYDLNHVPHEGCPECGWRRDSEQVVPKP